MFIVYEEAVYRHTIFAVYTRQDLAEKHAFQLAGKSDGHHEYCVAHLLADPTMLPMHGSQMICYFKAIYDKAPRDCCFKDRGPVPVRRQDCIDWSNVQDGTA